MLESQEALSTFVISPSLLLVGVLRSVRLCNPMDCSPPVSSARGIAQARILD